MRHGDKIKNLGRTQAHRMALMCNLTSQLIAHKRITTTLAKAKSLRVFAEPLITRCKVDNMNNRRVVFSYLQDKESIKELFGVISDKIGDRPGGYTRIIKLPRRAGDAADMAMIELVDFNEIYGKNAEAGATKKTRRSRRSSGAAKAEATDTMVATEEADVATEEASHIEDVVETEETSTDAVAEATEETTTDTVAEATEEATEEAATDTAAESTEEKA